MTTTFNQQLGPLRSEITFTLHTQYATRLWNGRDLVKNDQGEVSSPLFSVSQAPCLYSVKFNKTLNRTTHTPMIICCALNKKSYDIAKKCRK